MGEKSVKFPDKEVLKTLIKMHAETKEKVGSINGEFGDRCRTQQELNPDFTGPARKTLFDITYKGKTNELAARDLLRRIRGACDAAEEILNETGHVGDIAEMAQRAATQPVGSTPKEEPKAEEKQVADNVVALQKGIKPLAEKGKADVKAKADKAEKTSKAKTEKADKPKDSVDAFREGLRANNAKGDEHIKTVNEELATPQPEPPEAEKAPAPDRAEHGRYKLIS